MKKRGHDKNFLALGALFIIAGSVLMLNSFPKITGFSVYAGLSSDLSSVFSAVFMLIGLLFMNLGLEEKVSSPENYKIQSVISRKALERLKKDRFLKENKKRYISEIKKILASPNQRPQELISEFHVSPRGESGSGGPRIAWHYDPKEHKLYIDDLLYHVDQHRYVDDWATRVRKKEITLSQYLSSGYVNQAETALA